LLSPSLETLDWIDLIVEPLFKTPAFVFIRFILVTSLVSSLAAVTIGETALLPGVTTDLTPVNG
jgi:hypothetical protein